MQNFEQLLEYLMQPENEAEIQYLAKFKEIEQVDEMQSLRGIAGMITRFALKFARKHLDALQALGECETANDIASFRHTHHYELIREVEVGEDWKNVVIFYKK
ncbi:MAG: hypothetical protein FWC67_02540 [Defluviitaleaceae bacterium]|nr:hypothetical protein [Defluviitaleaceae bacterium]